MSSYSDEDSELGRRPEPLEAPQVAIPDADNPAARNIDALHGSASSIFIQISELADETEISFGAIVDALEERAFGLLILLFAIPAMIPFLVGVQSFVALPIIILSAQLIVGQKRPWLPRRVRRQTISMDAFRKMTKAVVPWLKRIERLTKPRLKFFAGRRAEPVLAILMIIFAAIVAIPGPGTNGVPGLAIALISLAMIERDGVLAIISSIAGIVYVILFVAIGYTAIEFALHQAMRFFGGA